MVKLKEIQLHPTDWKIDVWWYNVNQESTDKLDKLMTARYGIPYTEDIDGGSFVSSVDTTTKSKLKGTSRIVCVLSSLDIRIVVHESVHLMYRASSRIGYEINKDSQEWQACLMEYIVHEILDRKSYKSI